LTYTGFAPLGSLLSVLEQQPILLQKL